MVTSWQELDQCYDDVWENANDLAQSKKREEHYKAYMFLARVNRNLDEVKGRILGQKPLPSIREVFSEVRQEECKKRVMFGDTETSSKPEIENSALVSRGSDLEGERRKHSWYDHCKKPWHTRET